MRTRGSFRINKSIFKPYSWTFTASVCRVLGTQRYNNNPILADRWRMTNVRFSVFKSRGRLHLSRLAIAHLSNSNKSIHSSWNNYFSISNFTLFRMLVRLHFDYDCFSSERDKIKSCVRPRYTIILEVG